VEPRDAERIARLLIRRYLGRTWKFAWTNRRGIYAECDHGDRVIRFSRSATQTSNITEFGDTLAHELAHGIALRAGHIGHGHVWKKLARALGAKVRRDKDT
jgi:hypothetical protein